MADPLALLLLFVEILQLRYEHNRKRDLASGGASG